MFAIECDGIRVEADNEAEARKELRKAQRAAQKARDEKARLECIAEDKARARVFRVLSRVIAGDGMPSAWDVIAAGEPGCSVSFERQSGSRGILSVSDCERDSKGLPNYRTSSRECYAYGIAGVLENSAGEPLIVWIDETLGEEAAPYAIAGHCGVVGMVPLPKNITMEMFRRAGE